MGKIRSSSKDGVNGKFDIDKIIHTEENRMCSLIIWIPTAKTGGNKKCLIFVIEITVLSGEDTTFFPKRTSNVRDNEDVANAGAMNNTCNLCH